MVLPIFALVGDLLLQDHVSSLSKISHFLRSANAIHKHFNMKLNCKLPSSVPSTKHAFREIMTFRAGGYTGIKEQMVVETKSAAYQTSGMVGLIN